MSLLTYELTIFRTIRQRIADMAELSEDDKFVIDTASGECDLEDCIIRVLRESRQAKAMADGLKALLTDMKERQDRLERKAEKLKAIAHYALTEAGLQKISAPDFTASRGDGRPAVVVTEDDAEKIPDAYVRISREPDKIAIRKALEAGETLPFAYMKNGDEILTVRSR